MYIYRGCAKFFCTKMALAPALGEPCAFFARFLRVSCATSPVWVAGFKLPQSSPQTRKLNLNRRVLGRSPYLLYNIIYIYIYTCNPRTFISWWVLYPIDGFAFLQKLADLRRHPREAEADACWSASWALINNRLSKHRYSLHYVYVYVYVYVYECVHIYNIYTCI